MKKRALGEWIGDRPLEQLADLRQELNRLFDKFEIGHARFGREEEPFKPEVDIVEEKDKVTVTAELPGIDEKDVQVSVAQGMIDIRGEKYEERRTGRRAARRVQECRYGAFRRTLALPPGTDMDHGQADFRNGILTVTFPRTAAALEGGKKIAITERGFSPISSEAEEKKNLGEPGGGAGRVEVVRGSGVYPPGSADVPRGARQEAEHAFGQGERGAEGYEDSGSSGVLPPPEPPEKRE